MKLSHPVAESEGASKFYTGSKQHLQQVSSCIAYVSFFTRPCLVRSVQDISSSLIWTQKLPCFLPFLPHKTVTFPLSLLCLTVFLDELN